MKFYTIKKNIFISNDIYVILEKSIDKVSIDKN